MREEKRGGKDRKREREDGRKKGRPITHGNRERE